MLPFQFFSGLLFGLRRWPALVVIVVGLVGFGIARTGESPLSDRALDILWVGAANAIAGGLIHEVLVLLRRGVDVLIVRLFRRRRQRHTVLRTPPTS